jgi:hypothetical protein
MRRHPSAIAAPITLFALLLLVLTGWQASEAGVISSLAKLAKKADVDTPVTGKLDLNLPLDKDMQLARAHLDQNGDWHIQTQDLKSINISRQGQVADSKLVLIIDSHQLPPSLDDLNRIPAGCTLYVKQKQKVYRLTRGPAWTISHKQLSVKVNSVDEIKRVAWHLHRPWADKTIYVAGLPHQPNAGMAAKIQGASIQSFLKNPRQFQQQTLVVPGIREDKTFYVAGAESQALDMTQMKALARKYDTTLVFLHADGGKAVRKLGQTLQAAFLENTLYDDTAAFIQRLNPDAGAMTLEISPSGHARIVISARVKSAPPADPAAPEQPRQSPLVTGLKPSADLAGTLAEIYRPDQERSRELDRRIVPWLPSWLQYYVIGSLFLGVVAWSFSRNVWARLWRPKTRKHFNHSAAYILFRLGHEAVFLLVFLPLFGAICFVLNVLLVSYRVLRGSVLLLRSVTHSLFIKPVKLLLGYGQGDKGFSNN